MNMLKALWPKKYLYNTDPGYFYKYLLSWWVSIMGSLVFISTVYGVVKGFSSVPQMDQWNGYIGFYRQVSSGNYSAWLALHNEHRIFMSRILFWLDIKLFGGKSIFLVLVNFLLQFLIAGIFLMAYVKGAKNKMPWPILLGIIGLLLFSWMQVDNLILGFQSSFLFVCLFALSSFYWQAKIENENAVSRRYLLGSLGCALGATLSLANGLLVFPVLLFQCFYSRNSLKYYGVILVVLVIASILYFSGYTSPASHGSPLEGLTYHLYALLCYFLVFQGGPAFLLTGSKILALLTGFLITCVSLFLIGMIYFRREINSYRSLLSATIVFVSITAFGIASGRYSFGIQAAVSSRYLTLPLLNWLSIILLLFDVISEAIFWRVASLLSLILLPAMVYYQKHLTDEIPQRFYEKVAMLSLKMKVNDNQYMRWLLPPGMHSYLMNISTYAEKEDLSVYSSNWLHDVGRIKFSSPAVDNSWCVGSFDAVEKMPAGYFLRGRGWAALKYATENPLFIVFADVNGRTVGYGVSGEIRPDVYSSLPKAGLHAGWRGYVTSSIQAIDAYVYHEGSFCKLTNNITFVPEQLNKAEK